MTTFVRVVGCLIATIIITPFAAYLALIVAGMWWQLVQLFIEASR